MERFVSRSCHSFPKLFPTFRAQEYDFDCFFFLLSTQCIPWHGKIPKIFNAFAKKLINNSNFAFYEKKILKTQQKQEATYIAHL